MNPEYLDVEANTWITKDYPIDHDLDVNTLTEIYIIVYLLERKGRDPEEIYTFTTDFEQAFKRFKLLPNTQGFLKRILTDDDNLIALAKDGTKPKVTDPRLVIENKIEEVTEDLAATHIEGLQDDLREDETRQREDDPQIE